MGKVIMSGIVPQLVAPSGKIVLADIAEGSIVKVNENGNPVEFYVAKHNYEPSLNGTERTLLVRKDCYDTMAWHSSMVNAYATSDVDRWLNSTYKLMLDAGAQAAVGETGIYYTPGNGTQSVSELNRSVFLLSGTELGLESTKVNAEGEMLSIAGALLVANIGGAASTQWTRTPDTSDTRFVLFVRDSGTYTTYGATNKYGVRPCFTLPATAKFDEETLLFKGVS